MIIKYPSGLSYISELSQREIRGQEYSLEPIRTVLAHLGDPQDKFKSIIVGGTNGKGSVSCAVASIIAKAGFRSGLNTSPHLSRINERIAINGTFIADDLLDYCCAKIMLAVIETGSELSFHEAITAASFIALLEQDCEWGVFEVGVGGRLDAANIIKAPVVSTIVSVDFDHEALLGSTLVQIAREKVEIGREGRNLVLGAIPVEAREVIDHYCKLKRIKSISYGDDFNVRDVTTNMNEGQHYFNSREFGSFSFEGQMEGIHQAHNLGVAIATARAAGFSIQDCIAGVKRVRWPARLEHRTWEGRQILFDCAHNPAGVDSLVTYLRSRGYESLDCVFAALDTKNWKSMISKLSPQVNAWYIVEAQSSKAASSCEISDYLEKIGKEVRQFGRRISELLLQIKKANDEPAKMLLITGSIYMVGEIRSLMGFEDSKLWTD